MSADEKSPLLLSVNVGAFVVSIVVLGYSPVIM